MFQKSVGAENFYEYALNLFAQAGHTFADEPEYANHDADTFAWSDNGEEFYLSQNQRDNLKLFDNVSRLFTVGGIVFFSANLLALRRERSHIAYAVHELIQYIVDSEFTICLFRHEDKMIFSFASLNNHSILSDWYSFNDSEQILERLSIENMSDASEWEYFCDFIYLFKREYYFRNPLKHEKEIFEQLIIDKYGYDYVEYDKTPVERPKKLEIELDLDFDFD